VKLAGARAAAFCVRPDLRLTGALLHGPDAGLLVLRRRELVSTLTDGEDLRLTRLASAAALKDPAGLDAALRARGFFPGRRVVLIEDARDTLAAVLGGVLKEIGPEDAFLVLTAPALTARSALRRLFEGGAGLVALGLYPEPPDRAEIETLLGAAGLGAGADCVLTPEAVDGLAGLAGQIDRGALAQLVEKIALYALGRDAPLGVDELAALFPATADSEVDRLVAAVTEGRAEAVAPMVSRLSAAGIGPVAMLIAAGRHFRQLLGLAAAADGIDAALGRLRPPAFGARRTALAAQARRWGPVRLEVANRLLFQADRGLRSPGARPDRALVERCLIRLAMTAGR